MEITTPSIETPPRTEPERDPLHALLHEWFVRYNPIYLFSAALVLAGLTLVSFSFSRTAALASFGVTAIAEVYAFALIGGAAALVRWGARRAAVMVGLLAALYQCDLTMHVETCAFLSGVGFVGAVVWIGLFALKLRLLAAALELRPSRSALLVPTFGAAVVALLPQVARQVHSDAKTAWVAFALFMVAAAALWTTRHVESAVGFDYRGRRAIRGTWLMWAGGALLHVGYWIAELGVHLSGLVPAVVLLTTRWAKRERSVWMLVVATVAAVALLDARSLPITCVMASVVLVLRAFRAPIVVTPDSAPVHPPYRGAGPEPIDEAAVHATRETTFGLAEPIAMERLLLGAVSAAHLALWTQSVPSGLWLAHQPLLDLGLVAICAFAIWRGRRWQAVAPLAPLAVHLAIQLEWVTAPRDAGELGVWSIGLGFGLLGGALTVAWRAHHRALGVARTGP